MREFEFETSDGLTMVRVDKKTARALWARGASLIVLPCNANPSSPWYTSHPMNVIDYADFGAGYEAGGFEALSNAVSYYQCNSETGRYPSYYVCRMDIPRYYAFEDVKRKSDGVKGTIYTLCDKYDAAQVEDLKNRASLSGCAVITARYKYAPEMVKTALFVPYGTPINYL